MFDWYKYDILSKIDGTDSKLLIGLGDSFTQGQGACEIELYEKHNWDLNVVGSDNEKELWQSFYKNSWVNQICINHLTDYTPINLGMTGRGNRGAVKELYLHPELKLESFKEKIVIYMLSGMERFDFIHKNYNEHIHYITMWPNFQNADVNQKKLWDYYLEYIWNDRFGAIEMILNIAEAQTWCKANNATLYLVSAFRPDYRKENFIEMIKGDKNDEQNYLYGNDNYINQLINIIDWNRFIRLSNYNCVTDFLCHLEKNEKLINVNDSRGFWEFVEKIDKISDKGYVTKCGHPSVTGHKEIAKILYEEIKTTKKLI